MDDLPSSEDGEKIASTPSKISGEPDASDRNEGYPSGVRLGMMLLALILAMFFVSMPPQSLVVSWLTTHRHLSIW